MMFLVTLSLARCRCHTLALSNGRVYAFGLNGSGQLGDGTFRNALIPRTVEGLQRVSNVFSGWDQSVFVEDDHFQVIALEAASLSVK